MSILGLIGMLFHACDENRIAQLYEVKAQSVGLVFELFKTNGRIDIVRSGDRGRVIEMISEQVKKETYKWSAHDVGSEAQRGVRLVFSFCN